MSDNSIALDQAWKRLLRERVMLGERTNLWITIGILSFALITLLWNYRLVPNDLVSLDGSLVDDVCWPLVLAILTFATISTLIRSGRYQDWMPFLNTTLQVSLMFYLLRIDLKAVADNPPASLPPALYNPILLLFALVMVGLTSFRLNPALSIYAGLLASAEIVVINLALVRPLLAEQGWQTAYHANYGLNFSMYCVLAYLSGGIGASLASFGLRKVFRRSVEESQQAAHARTTFGRYVSSSVARAALAGENAVATNTKAAVLFCDFRGFTAYSGGRPPGEVAGQLNHFWEDAARIVEDCGGTINKFLGDGFLAVFGAPAPLDNPSAGAATAAWKLRRNMHGKLSPLGMDICLGLNHGPLIAGEIGSGERCEYTVIGETVNIASRLEHLNRELKTGILMTTSMASLLPSDFEVRHLGPHPIRGIDHPVELTELLGMAIPDSNTFIDQKA